MLHEYCYYVSDNQTPRQKDSIRSQLTEIKVDGSNRAQWILCEHEMAPLVTRMKAHVEGKGMRHVDELPGPSSSKILCLKQTTLGFDSSGPDKQHALNSQLARYPIATNTVFLATDNGQLKKLFDLPRPGTKIPDQKLTGGPSLEERFQVEKKGERNEGNGHFRWLVDYHK